MPTHLIKKKKKSRPLRARRESSQFLHRFASLAYVRSPETERTWPLPPNARFPPSSLTFKLIRQGQRWISTTHHFQLWHRPTQCPLLAVHEGVWKIKIKDTWSHLSLESSEKAQWEFSIMTHKSFKKRFHVFWFFGIQILILTSRLVVVFVLHPFACLNTHV